MSLGWPLCNTQNLIASQGLALDDYHRYEREDKLKVTLCFQAWMTEAWSLIVSASQEVEEL